MPKINQTNGLDYNPLGLGNKSQNNPQKLIKGSSAMDLKFVGGLASLRESFRGAGGRNDVIGEQFNRYDTPGWYYFRVFFDFSTPSGLIYPGYNTDPEITKWKSEQFGEKDAQYPDTALNYLMVNGEFERADMLKHFIRLLSNISARSPWYFTSLEGLSELMDRPEYGADAFTIGEPKMLTIKCLPDAYDGRIGTLLDLYKSIVISQKLHKFILPENLQLFNMFIYIFPVSIASTGSAALHYASYDVNNSMEFTEDYFAGAKLFELRGCRLNWSDNKSGFGSVNNTDGFQQEYSLSIIPKMMYETRYNDLLMMNIGDHVLADLFLEENGDSRFNGGSGALKDNEGTEYAMVNTGLTTKTLEEIEDINRPKRPRKPDALEQTFNPSVGTADKPTDHPGLNDKMVRGGNSFIGSKLGSAVDKLAGQAKTVMGAVTSTVNSYSPSNIMNAGMNALGDTVNKMMFGNLFRDTITSVTSNVSSAISGFSADALINKTARGGWSKTTSKKPGSSLGTNLFEQY